jgi:archaellum biogenesis protein FlaJ (TadC family)
MFGLKNLSPKDHISDSSFFLTPDVATETASSHVAQRWPFSIALMRLISTADLGASFKKSLATLQ